MKIFLLLFLSLLLPMAVQAEEFFKTKKQVVINELKIFSLKHNLKLTESLCVEIYDSAWLASRHNPAWGPRELVAIKLICVQPKESWFNRKAVNVNKNGTIDVGVMQINSCNWFYSGWWEKFCEGEKYNKKRESLLFSRYFNVEYAAWLNERFKKNGIREYQYYSTKEQKELYDAILNSLGFVFLAERFNDGQYIKKEEVR